MGTIKSEAGQGGRLNVWTVFQVFVDISFGIGLFLITMRLSRAPKDDPRLSRGLQLLQSKISVLEDLSDRTEAQVSQLSNILEQKVREVQMKISEADRQVHSIRSSMEQSLEVAKIFQDKIPHSEIIERQNTIKYVQAARLAHQGRTIDEIASQVDLPQGELEFIAKINREQLMFSIDSLPPWAQAELQQQEIPQVSPAQEQQSQFTPPAYAAAEAQAPQIQRDWSQAFDVPPPSTESLSRLGEEFRKACEQSPFSPAMDFSLDDTHQFAEAPALALPPMLERPPEILARVQTPSASQPVAGTQMTSVPVMPLSQMPRPATTRAALQARVAASSVPMNQRPLPKTKGEPVIRKVEFPKIQSPDEVG